MTNQETLSYLTSQGFTKTVLDRFWIKVKKTDDCWIWTGSTNGCGHGQITKGGKNGVHEYAHRLSWMIHKGPIPDGLFVLHNCPNGDCPSCVNPNHLKLGTQKENQQDMARKGRSHKGYKLSDDDVRQIRELRGEISGKMLAAMFGISQVTVSQICSGHLHSRTYKSSL